MTKTLTRRSARSFRFNCKLFAWIMKPCYLNHGISIKSPKGETTLDIINVCRKQTM